MTSGNAPAAAGRRRVAVTGLGLATSLGFEVEEVWQALLAGRSGIGVIEQFGSHGFPVRIGAEIAAPPPSAEARAQPNRTRRFALWAARRAWDDAGLDAAAFDRWRAAVVIGAGVSPVMEDRLSDHMFDGEELSTASHLERCRERPELLSQLALPAVSSELSARLGLSGPSITVQSACTSATQAIGEAFARIGGGQLDVVLTGGADSMMSMFCVAGFDQLGALSRHPDPRTASRPFDARRDGFVLGEGAGMLVLEDLGHARRRGARIHGEVIGYGSSSDAYRFTDIAPGGRGAAACLDAALRSAGLPAAAVGYINAHGTATPQNDRLETLAIKQVFGAHARRLAVSSTKSQLGHLICAAGGVEAVVTVLALQRGVLPPTSNLDHPDPECDLDYVPREARPAAVDVALSSSFGFGGQNAVLAARRWEGE
jgi:3-oxoacyl-[acyl-carrier-protein] synthase II